MSSIQQLTNLLDEIEYIARLFDDAIDAQLVVRLLNA